MERPPWLDPARDLVLTPKTLKGIVHPVRLRLLELLQADGPATASGLAARIGQSSGVTSYHLRVLAEHGFITEDAERGTARDRWWRANHRAINFSFRVPGEPPDADTIDDAETFMRYSADSAHQRMLAFVSEMAGQLDELPQVPWCIDEWPLRLTRDEARELVARIRSLVSEYRREPGDPDPREGTERAALQFQLLPDEPGR